MRTSYETKLFRFTADYECDNVGYVDVTGIAGISAPIKRLGIRTAFILNLDQAAGVYMNANTLFPNVSICNPCTELTTTTAPTYALSNTYGEELLFNMYDTRMPNSFRMSFASTNAGTTIAANSVIIFHFTYYY